MLRAWLTLLLLLLVTPPAAGQQSTGQCTSECDPRAPDVNGEGVRTEGPVKIFLYPHLGVAGFTALNTQRPPPGSLTSPLELGDRDLCSEFVWNHRPGMVEYLDGAWRTHQEGGLAGPVQVNRTGNVAYVYARPQADTAPVDAPISLRVDVLVETGRFVHRGTPLLSGTTATTFVDGLPLVDAIEFRIHLDVHEGMIPVGADAKTFIASVRICHARLAGQDVGVRQWTLENRETYYNRLILNVDEPIQSTNRSATANLGQLYVRASWVALFGAYDLADTSVKLDATSPQGRLDPSKINSFWLRRSIDHAGYMKPVNATWRIALDDLIGQGPWTFRMSVENLQGTFRSETRTVFEATAFEGVAVPGPETALALAIVLAAAVVQRVPGRRRRS